ncbi:MAG: diguanylate cyclase [Anaerovoracaceae bacterium]
MKSCLYKGIGIFLVFLMFLSVFTGCENRDNRQTESPDEEDKFIEYLITEDSYQYDSEIIAEWNTAEHKDVFMEKSENDEGRSFFILGSTALFDGDTENAAQYFKKAGDEANDSDCEMKARSYYELSKCYIYLGEYDKAKDSIARMSEVYDGKEKKDYLIKLNLWLSYDMLEMPNGVNKAIDLMEDTLQIAGETEYHAMEDVLSMLARLYAYSDESVKTMQYQLEALDYAKKNKNTNKVVRILTDIGTDYQSKGNYNEAIRYLNNAYSNMQSFKTMTQSQLSMGAYITDHLFTSYLLSGDLENADKSLKESLEFINREESGREKKDDLTKYYTSLARYEINNGEYEVAAKHVQLAEQRYNNDPNFSFSDFDIEIYMIYGDINLAIKNFDEALEYYKKVEEIFIERLELTPYNPCLRGLYNAYKGKGDFENAEYYAEALMNSLEEDYIMQENQQASYMLEKFQSEQREQQIQNLQEKNRILFLIVIISVVVVAVFSALAVIINSKNKKIQQLNHKLTKLSECDSLTGLYNRRAMGDFLHENWELIMAQKKLPSMIMMDVDYFKKYNDYYGHQKGDEVLESVGKAILEQIRATDFPIRYGGEEFLIILPETSGEEACAVAKRINNTVSELQIPHEKSDVADYVTVSIGVAAAMFEESSENVLKRADKALYKAKKTRNTIEVE